MRVIYSQLQFPFSYFPIFPLLMPSYSSCCCSCSLCCCSFSNLQHLKVMCRRPASAVSAGRRPVYGTRVLQFLASFSRYVSGRLAAVWQSDSEPAKITQIKNTRVLLAGPGSSGRGGREGRKGCHNGHNDSPFSKWTLASNAAGTFTKHLKYK